MRDKTDQIIRAAIKVFIRKGFLQATTQEIAKEADVAEITLYRKFSTKQNLFSTVIKKVVERQFSSGMMKLADLEDTDTFFKGVLEDRLEVLSENEALIKMLLSESLMGNLSDEINFPKVIFTNMKRAIETHFSKKQQDVDSESLARQLSGILISHILFPAEKPFHESTDQEKQKIIDRYVQSLLATIK